MTPKKPKQNKVKKPLAIAPDLVALLDQRNDNFSGAVDRALKRYFAIVQRERLALRDVFTDGETGLILDVCNGLAWMDEHGPAFIRMEISDGIALNAMDEKWGVDAKALDKKMAGLAYHTLCALADAVECWWQRVATGENPPHAAHEVFK